MQHVTAFSRPQTLPALPRVARKPSCEEAKMYYVAALRLGPSRAPVYSNLGNLYLKRGQVSQAIVQFGEALRLNPGAKDAEENLRLAKAADAQLFPQPR